MADHKHGAMNIKHQEQTFDSFIRFVVRGTAISLAILVFLAIFRS